MRITILIAILAMIGGVTTTAYNKYAVMKTTIQNQAIQLNIAKGNLITQQKVCENRLKTAVASAIAKEKKKAIMKEIKYDNSKAVSTSSINYYIAH